jgi:hypothetical protein
MPNMIVDVVVVYRNSFFDTCNINRIYESNEQDLSQVICCQYLA